jgi:hypothetical protein
MLRFFDLERIEAKKRDVVERIKDFDEIYEIFQPNKSKEQSERCIQCGDPYCHNGCPLHNFIPQWLKATANKDLEFAFNLSNQSSPFPEVMGRICPHDRLCEGSCTLNDGYGAITIGSVEAHISEEGFKQGLKPKFSTKKLGKKVAIIGAGPAGLSAATFLLREGVDVELFDKQNRAGGLLTYGIPGFKLNKNVIARRVKILKEAGAVFHQNVEVGKDVSFEEDALSTRFAGISPLDLMEGETEEDPILQDGRLQPPVRLENHLELLQDDLKKVAGVDVANEGDDISIIIVRHGPHVIDVQRYPTQDVMEMCGYIIRTIDEFDLDEVVIDCTGGWGAGIYARLLEQGIDSRVNITEVKGNQKPRDDTLRALNARAEMFLPGGARKRPTDILRLLN